MAKTPAAHEFAGFSPGVIQFFGELALNNEREWWEANKARYEREVREPALAFVRAMKPKLAKISKHMVAIDKKAGGSIMRPHRDVRFGADKTPYKTNLGVQFRHEVGKDVHAPGFYLHFDVDQAFLAAGTWHPEASALTAIRSRITTHAKAWAKARDDAAFNRDWALAGESLVRPPRGFAKDDPMIEDLKRKDHIAVCNLKVAEFLDPNLVELVAKRLTATKPYMKFLCAALDVPF